MAFLRNKYFVGGKTTFEGSYYTEFFRSKTALKSLQGLVDPQFRLYTLSSSQQREKLNVSLTTVFEDSGLKILVIVRTKMLVNTPPYI